MFGTVVDARKSAVENGITNNPSACFAAARVINGPSAPTNTGGRPNGLGPGLKVGVIKV
ncbi:Uncharacterised protein [Mycobacteroides abscessus subsp. abscessus]|nr:Uncharacterised protein [Mycobacteroides abscessus subsp. abscessus]